MSVLLTRRRRTAVGTIHDVVNAMRAIAAGRIQGAQRALASARQYEAVVLRALASLRAEGLTFPRPRNGSGARVLLVMTSEQPLCGAFNQNILALAGRRWRELRQSGDVHLIVVGQRGQRLFAAHGIPPGEGEVAATSLDGLPDLVKRLAARVDRRLAEGTAGALHVIYSRYQSVSEQVPEEEQIPPFDPARLPVVTRLPRQTHRRYLGAADLLAGLIGEYAFIGLYRTAADSFASEQASRLIAMDGATRNTERMLQSLLDLERRERQEEITRQVLELLAARFASE
jgi:F-type H+-transporting ATPase subunit gamma